MKKVLRNVYNKCFKHFLPQSIRQKLKRVDAKEYPIIIHPEEMYEKVYHIKDATWETEEMFEVWNMSKSYKLAMHHPEQDILRIEKAYVIPRSDVAITEQGVVWDKFYMPIFSYSRPLDADVLDYDNDKICVRKANTVIKVEGECLSMLGVFAGTWSHFIVQFLPKIYYAERAGLLDKNITVIVPNYKDAQVKELVYNVLNKHKTCKVKEDEAIDSHVRYACDILYWIPTASAISNDTLFPFMYHNIIPKQVMDILHGEVFGSYPVQKDGPKYDKIYLVRRNAAYRNVINVDEVEQFFKEKGFVLIHPEKMSMIEKLSVFRHAKWIAGPHSSAWTNAMFCHQANGLMITPTSWTHDSFLGYNIRKEECDIKIIPGIEKGFHSSQNDFYVSMKDVQDAYNSVFGTD